MFKKGKKRGFSAKSGQATIEYILLLVIVIFLARFILTPLGEGLRRFSGALVGPGGYYSCLMENGLLPRLDAIEGGVNCKSKKAEAVAFAQAKIASIEENLANQERRSNRIKNAKAARDREREASDKNSKNGKRRNKKNSSTSQAGSSGQQIGGDLSSNSHRKKRRKRKKRTKIGNLGGTGFKPDKFETPQKQKTSKRKSRVRFNDDGFLGAIYIDEEEKRKRNSLTAASSGERNKGVEKEATRKRLIAHTKREPSELKEKVDTSFKLGGFLKYFFIGAMIVAILLVVFSQVMEFQNRD